MILKCVILNLDIPLCNSLKAKRSVLRSIKKKIQNKYNASIAEIDNQDYWKTATIAISMVGNDRIRVENYFKSIYDFIEENYYDVEIRNVEVFY